MKKFPTISLLITVFLLSIAAFAQQQPGVPGGSLIARDKQGELGVCPLKTTKVRADISGFVTRVTVVQEFENTYSDPIEALYTFPLSQNGAVDDMTIRIGERVIRGRIMKREEAKKVYETAKAAGQVAALLDQQRPNIFSQSIANIMPGEKISVEISYVETLKYENGEYEFVFPMVVGTRYNPAAPGKGIAPVDAAVKSPPVAERPGHDISIEVNLDAGMAVEGIRSTSHEIETLPVSAESSKVRLKTERTIPNKDFILRYDVTGKQIGDALITHRGPKGGFFTMMVQPPNIPAPKDITPKEIVFVLDTSGSMNGFPIEKAKESMMLALEGLNPQDTFNIITFAGDTEVLFNQPVRATAGNMARARQFLESRKGGGGTEMMKAINAALQPTTSFSHMRIVCFMTDGHVGNEKEILAAIQTYKNARIFSFGIGNSINRYLLDRMAAEGRGEVEYVTLKDDGSAAAKRFHERVRSPLLTDISLDGGAMEISDMYPGRQPDLFSSKPVAITGRFSKAGVGPLTLRGKIGGQDYSRVIQATLPESETANDALASIWARARVTDLMSKLLNAEGEVAQKQIENEITQLGLEFRLMTQYTSFVAVEERIVNQNGNMVKMEVPVNAVEGTTTVADDVVNSTQISTLPLNSRYFSQTTPYAPSIPSTSPPFSLSGTGTIVPARIERPEGERKADIGTGAGPISAILNRMNAHRRNLLTLRAPVKIVHLDPKATKLPNSRDGNLIATLRRGQETYRIDSPISVYSFTGNKYKVQWSLDNRQIEGDAANDPLAIALRIMVTDPSELKQRYNINYIGAEKVEPGARDAWHLKFNPRDDKVNKAFEAWVDGDGMIIKIVITEAEGSSTTLLFNEKVQKNVTVRPEEFIVNVPGDVKTTN